MSNKELQFNPTKEQMFELEGRGRYNFVRHKERIDALVAECRYAEACEARYEAFQLLVDALPEDASKMCLLAYRDVFCYLNSDFRQSRDNFCTLFRMPL